MPQMSPLSWTFIFLLLVISMATLHSNMPFVPKNKVKCFYLTKKENSMKW